METETMEFATEKEFQHWKRETEVKCQAMYAASTGKKCTGTSSLWYYSCSRSGFYKSRSIGKRKLKSQGTSKIARHCTSTMKVSKSKEDGSYTVHFTKTHYGHENELCHLKIPLHERQAIAGRLQQGVSSTRVIGDVRDNITELGRLHLITKQDIRNIEREFGLQLIERHKDDATSVRSTMCKHIHLVNLKMKQTQFTETNNATQAVETEDAPREAVDLQNTQCLVDLVKIQQTNLTMRKQTVQQRLHQLTSQLSDCKSEEVLKGVEEHVVHSLSLLQASSTWGTTPNVWEKTSEPSNKMITPQRSFTKKRKLSLQRPKIAKPSRDEQDRIAMDLLLPTNLKVDEHDYCA